MDERDKDWLKEIDNIMNDINEMPIEKMNSNTRRNNMRKQLIILKTRMGYDKNGLPFKDGGKQ